MSAWMWSKGNHFSLSLGLCIGTVNVENSIYFYNSINFSQKLELIYNPAIPLLGINPKRKLNTHL